LQYAQTTEIFPVTISDGGVRLKRPFQNREIAIKRTGSDEVFWGDLYHRFLRLSWLAFFGYLLMSYFLVNLFFAMIYNFFPGCIAHIEGGDLFSCFAFSVQTLSTVGYGFFYPQSTAAHVIVTAESAVGMFFTAVLTGLIFAKFARPSARILFSSCALLTKRNGKPALILRLCNTRGNRVFEGRARLSLLRDEVTSEGERFRRFHDLKIVSSSSPVFSLTWTLIHLIDEDSPLAILTPEQMAQEGSEFHVMFSGLDQDMSQTITASTNYSAESIIRAKKFADMIHLEGRVRVIDYSKLHDVILES
jgi:inward rectifier potassium channel